MLKKKNSQHLKIGVEVIFSIFHLYSILLTFILGITFKTHKLNIPNYKKRGIKNVKITSTFKFDKIDNHTNSFYEFASLIISCIYFIMKTFRVYVESIYVKFLAISIFFLTYFNLCLAIILMLL